MAVIHARSALVLPDDLGDKLQHFINRLVSGPAFLPHGFGNASITVVDVTAEGARERLANYRPDAPYLYVSDGGHWENLGIVEALRRGCTELIVISASGMA